MFLSDHVYSRGKTVTFSKCYEQHETGSWQIYQSEETSSVLSVESWLPLVAQTSFTKGIDAIPPISFFTSFAWVQKKKLLSELWLSFTNITGKVQVSIDNLQSLAKFQLRAKTDIERLPASFWLYLFFPKCLYQYIYWLKWTFFSWQTN